MRNLNPYLASTESAAFVEDALRLRIDELAAERNAWRSRAESAEHRAEAAEQELGRVADRNQCTVWNCENRQVSRGVAPLCAQHLEAACRDQMILWSEQMSEDPKKVPVDIRRRLAERPWVVYYIAMGDRVKIGRSANLAERMKSLYVQPDQLLAVEPGVTVNGVNREIQRHREFAQWRMVGTELFEKSEELSLHIEQVVATFGDPHRYIT